MVIGAWSFRVPFFKGPPLLTRARLIKLVIAIVVLVPLVYLGRRYYGELHRLRDAPPMLVVAMIICYLATRAINGQVLRVCMRALGHAIGFVEAWMLVILTSYANLLVPRVGIGMPAVYLKATHGVPFTDFGAQSLIATMLQLVTIGALGLACEVVLALGYGARAPWPITVSFAAVLIAGIGAVFIRVPAGREPAGREPAGRIARVLQRVGEGWTKMGNPRTVLVAAAWNVPMLLLRAWRVQMSFYAVGQPVSYPAALLASLLGDLAFFVSVTPAALGFREAAISYSAPLLNTTPDVALAASILDRLVWSMVVILIAQVGMLRMIRPALRKSPHVAQPTSEGSNVPA